jgi:hypothetical protein
VFAVSAAHLPFCRSYLKQFGHLADVPRARLLGLDKNSRSLKSAVESYQASDINAGPIDGILGPKTLAAMQLPRCECPDVYGDPEVAGGMLLGTGSGSWPHSCHAGYPNIHAVTVDLATSGMQAAWRDNLSAILAMLVAAENAVGLHPIFRLDGTGGNMRITWGRLIGGTIGWNTIPSRPTCGSSITGKIDSTWNASPVMLARLAMHEWFGHGVGRGHTRGGILNPTMTDGGATWVGDVSYPVMVSYFGGPIQTKPPIVPPPAPPIDPPPTPVTPCSELLALILQACGGPRV